MDADSSNSTPEAPSLPDFNLVQECYTTLGQEVGKLSALSAINDGTAVLNTLAELREQVTQMQGQMTQMQGQMTQMQGQMDIRFDRIETRIQTLDSNSLARTRNNLIFRPEQELDALYNPLTGLPIPNFPKTPAAVEGMSSANLNEILRALGISTGGNAKERRDRLRLYVGLRRE